jgi:hypothetical protein
MPRPIETKPSWNIFNWDPMIPAVRGNQLPWHQEIANKWVKRWTDPQMTGLRPYVEGERMRAAAVLARPTDQDVSALHRLQNLGWALFLSPAVGRCACWRLPVVRSCPAAGRIENQPENAGSTIVLPVNVDSSDDYFVEWFCQSAEREPVQLNESALLRLPSGLRPLRSAGGLRDGFPNTGVSLTSVPARLRYAT